MRKLLAPRIKLKTVFLEQDVNSVLQVMNGEHQLNTKKKAKH